MVAPFWDDSDLTGTGYALYDVITSSDDELGTIKEVNDFLKTTEHVNINANWVIVARWIDVCPFSNRFCLDPSLQVCLLL